MKFALPSRFQTLGIRSKLILLFVLIKVVPLILIAVVAWEGVTRLGSHLGGQTDQLTGEVRETVGTMGKTFSKEAERALDNRAREEIERLTTDTARAVADFLHDRDRDILLAAQIPPAATNYQRFIDNRKRGLVATGEWTLNKEGKGWEPVAKATTAQTVTPSNPENKQDFNYRIPESVQRTELRPLYHEITFVGLDGREKFKASNSSLLPRQLLNISQRDNTYCKAEDYFAALKKLKPGEIYVSDVVGPYVPSRVIGPVTPEKAKSLNIAYEPEKEAYAGKENPKGKRFQGIIRWATPVTQGGSIVGYVTLALDHSHVMSFTDNLMPTPARYTGISDATNGNYAFIWDYLDRSIAHPRHHSIVGFDPNTGEYATPWLEASLYEGWKASGKPLRQFLADIPAFDQQTRNKKPAKALTQAGMVGLECRYLNFAPQCQGWHDLTQHGGSGSFLILWTGVWKLTTAATIPYYTGHYGNTPRGFGYVTIGANVDDFHKPAQATTKLMDESSLRFGERMKTRQQEIRQLIADSMQSTAFSLTVSTVLMIALVVVIAIWLASMLTRRITDLIAGLNRIEQGELSFRFPENDKDELGKLNHSLNSMARSVEESFARLEEAKHQAEEASRLKSDFLARMSHELRTPLNGILGFAELIRMDAPNKECEEHASTIYESGQHLLNLVNDVLDLAKIESGNMVLETVEFRLKPLLEEIAHLHRASAESKGLQLLTELADNLPELVATDPTRLRQVINNLLSNAVKFTDQGEIRLKAWISSAGENNTPQTLHIRIQDTGCGIPPEAHALVFEHFRQAGSFVTRTHGGTGLGLALVRQFAELMHGTIHLESAVGEGAAFEFILPITTPEMH